jgi:hypothetical protein
MGPRGGSAALLERRAEERNRRPWKAWPEKTKYRRCVMAKISVQPEIEDEGNKVIFLLSLHKSEKLIKYWLRCVTAKKHKFVMVLGKCHSLRCPLAYYVF